MTLALAGYKMPSMKKVFLILLGLVAAFQTVNAFAYVEKQTAIVRVMNKAAGRAQTVTLPVGQTAEFEKLNITVRACKQTDPFQPEDFVAFIEITKNSDSKIFSGWSSRNEPGDNPLQDADYDLWLVKCE